MQENNLQQITCRIPSEGDVLRESACEDKQQSGYEAQHASGAERPGADFESAWRSARWCWGRPEGKVHRTWHRFGKEFGRRFGKDM